ncbi:MAG: mechanosensitive ion channel [Candidatus Omnitrophica bacterium]|nr:mechanosensitive ion channel [Candidatus Omnitrophota bacterium]
MKIKEKSSLLNLIIIFAFILSASLFAAAQSSYKAVTTKDPQIPLAYLEILLKPLTKEELKVEADAWMLLLKNKVKQISDAEIEAKKKSEEVAQAKQELKDKKEDVSQAQEKVEEKVQEVEETQKEIEKKVQEVVDKKSEIQDAVQEKKTQSPSTPTIVQEDKEQDLQQKQDEVQKQVEEIKETKKKVESTAVEIQKASKEVEAKAKELSKVEEKVDVVSEEKIQKLKSISDLRNERTALIDRLNLVLDKCSEKGGEIGEYSSYINAVSGIDLDVSDASAFWLTIVGWLESPEGGVRWAWNVSFCVLTIIAFWIGSIIAGHAVRKAVSVSKKMSDLLRDFLDKSVRRVIMAIGLVMGLSMLEININPLLAAIGGAAFIIAFALQGTLSNFASGILILVYRPFDVGDVIDAAGVSGIVESMNLVSTHIKTFDNKKVMIPNNSIWGGIITNVTGKPIRRIDMVFGIRYEDDIDKAQHILEDIIAHHELVLKDPPPVIRLHELGDSSVNFICRPWSKTADYWSIYWDVTRAVKQRFDQEGITIPYPQQDVHIYSQSKE